MIGQTEKMKTGISNLVDRILQTATEFPVVGGQLQMEMFM
jgi:hypothetical protein